MPPLPHTLPHRPLPGLSQRLIRATSLATLFITLLALPPVSTFAGPTATGSTQASSRQESVSDAVGAAQIWLHEVDADQYAKAWERAAPAFQNQISKTQWDVQMIRIRGLLGSVKGRKLGATSVKRQLPGLPDGHYVVVLYASQFEQKVRGSESVTVQRQDNGQWQVVGYLIR